MENIVYLKPYENATIETCKETYRKKVWEAIQTFENIDCKHNIIYGPRRHKLHEFIINNDFETFYIHRVIEDNEGKLIPFDSIWNFIKESK